MYCFWKISKPEQICNNYFKGTKCQKRLTVITARRETSWALGFLQLVTFKNFPCCGTEKDILKGFLVESLNWRDKDEALRRPRQLEFWEHNFVEDRCLDQGWGQGAAEEKRERERDWDCKSLGTKEDPSPLLIRVLKHECIWGNYLKLGKDLSRWIKKKSAWCSHWTRNRAYPHQW